MNTTRRSLFLDRLARVLWAAVLVTVPVTSFRYFPAGEGTYVRPLAFLPILVLLPVMAIRAVRRETDLPRSNTLVPLIVFLLLAAMMSLHGLIMDPLPMRGQDVVGRLSRAWVTVFMGLAFFVAAIWMNRDEADLRYSVKWLLVGFGVNILWSGLQAATFYLQLLPKPLVTEWQRAFSLRELIRTNRISGLAYEPSWLAGQVATVYLPWLLAAALTRIRAFRLRWLEPVMLLAAALMVLAAFSRGGILASTVSAGLVVLLAAGPERRLAWKWFTAGHMSISGLAARTAIAIVTLAAIAGGLLWVAQKDYVSRLWETRAEDLVDFLVQNSAGARGAYLASAIAIYEEHPWTGVGLGASGMYMYSRLPDWALTSVPEIARQLSPENSLYPNPKNMYARLLAETGLPGLFAYISFLFVLLAHSLEALQRNSPMQRYLGMAALCTWLALAIYNFTQDSFATPNLWLNLGMLAGLSGMVEHSRDGSVGIKSQAPVSARAAGAARTPA